MLLNLARMWWLWRLYQEMNPSVFSAGSVLTASALNDVTLGNFSSWTPVFGNDGTATYTTRTGWYCKIGASNVVFMNAYFTINAAGSGATDLTMTAPSNIDRTTRQAVGCDWTDSGGNTRIGHVLANVSGSGNVFDKVRVTNQGAVGAGNMSGAGLLAGSFFVAQGFYREQ